MNLSGHVDVFKETQISGWVADLADKNRQLFVEISVNSTPVASIRGSVFREDLIAAGIGDGCKGFFFDPSAYLNSGDNSVDVRYAGTQIAVPDGQARLNGVSGQTSQQLLDLSQERWKRDEPEPGLTWGAIFTGDSFVDALQQHYQFSPDHHICEIGPGYGRLLKTILDRKLPFGKYTGVELSEERTQKLNAQYGSGQIEFVTGDVNTAKLPRRADLVFCSSTFEHLFPDCTAALRNLIEQNLADRGRLAIDFIQADAAMKQQNQIFESQGHAFVRIYSAAELEGIYADCGISPVRFGSIVLGQAAFGPVRRIFTFGSRR